MAMLEAFVHDPLINWRLLNTTDAAPETLAREAEQKEAGEEQTSPSSVTERIWKEHSLASSLSGPGDVYCVSLLKAWWPEF